MHAPSTTFGYTSIHTEVVLSGTVAKASEPLDIFGAKYVTLTMSDVETVWTPSGAIDAEASREDFVAPDEIRVTEEQASNVPVGSTATFFLGWSNFKGQASTALIPIGGLDGIETDPQRTAERVANLDAQRAQRDSRVQQTRANATAALTPAVDAHGRIPLPIDPPDTATQDTAALYSSPLVIEQSDRTIVFDKWFFTLLDGTATVTVFDPDGVVLLEGLKA